MWVLLYTINTYNMYGLLIVTRYIRVYVQMEMAESHLLTFMEHLFIDFERVCWTKGWFRVARISITTMNECTGQWVHWTVVRSSTSLLLLRKRETSAVEPVAPIIAPSLRVRSSTSLLLLRKRELIRAGGWCIGRRKGVAPEMDTLFVAGRFSDPKTSDSRTRRFNFYILYGYFYIHFYIQVNICLVCDRQYNNQTTK